MHQIEPQHPYLDTAGVMEALKEYASPRSKLTTMLKKGELIKVRRGLYIPGDTRGYSSYTLANIIYGPSYVSFESALSYHGMIPEQVHSITSACYNKNRNKRFATPVGVFLYRYVNAAVYPYNVSRIETGGSSFLMASPEKAVCDTLSKVRGVSILQGLKVLLYDDMRMDAEILMKLDKQQVAFLSGLYRKRAIYLLCDYLNG